MCKLTPLQQLQERVTFNDGSTYAVMINTDGTFDSLEATAAIMNRYGCFYFRNYV